MGSVLLTHNLILENKSRSPPQLRDFSNATLIKTSRSPSPNLRGDMLCQMLSSHAPFGRVQEPDEKTAQQPEDCQILERKSERNASRRINEKWGSKPIGVIGKFGV